jgi:hypothetical protein
MNKIKHLECINLKALGGLNLKPKAMAKLCILKENNIKALPMQLNFTTKVYILVIPCLNFNSLEVIMSWI